MTENLLHMMTHKTFFAIMIQLTRRDTLAGEEFADG